MTTANIQTPGPKFNIAQHLLNANASRLAKTAFVDDADSLSFGQLAQRVQRAAAALQALGLSALHRVRHQAAEDGDRQDPALQAAGARI